MSYLFLAGAIVFEVAGTSSMKLTEGFTRPWWTLLLVLCYAASLGLLTLSLKEIPIGVAYAIWSGLGTALIAVVSYLVFRETLTVLQMLSVTFIVAGVVGLNLFAKVH